MLNFGVGFIFKGKDQGATKAARRLNEALENIDETASHAASISRWQKLSVFIETVSAVSIRQLAERVKGLSEQVHESFAGKAVQDSLTVFERGAIEVDKALERVRVNIGEKTAKALEKYRSQFVSTAVALNLGVEEVVEAYAALVEQHLTLRDVGFKNLKDYMKFLKAAGLDAKAWAVHMSGFLQSFRLPREVVREFHGQIIYISQTMRMGAAALSLLPEIATEVGAVAAKVTKNEQEASQWTLKMIKQVYLLAAAFKAQGMSSEEAIQKAREVFGRTAGIIENWQKVLVGLGSGLESLGEQAGVFQGDIRKLFEAAQRGPLDFAAALRQTFKYWQELAAQGMPEAQVALSRLQHILGENADLLWLLRGNLDLSAKQIARLRAETEKGAGGFGKYQNAIAKAYRTGRSLTEWLELAQERVRYAFRRIAQKDVVQYTKRLLKSYGLIAKNIDKLGTSNTALGQLMRKAALVSRMGWMALIPPFENVARVFKKMPKDALKTEEGMRALAKAFGKDIVGMAKGIAKTIGQIIVVLVRSAPQMIKGIYEGFKEAWPELKQAFWEAGVAFYDTFMDVIDTLDWSKIGSAIWDALVKTVGEAKKLGAKILDKIVEFFGAKEGEQKVAIAGMAFEDAFLKSIWLLGKKAVNKFIEWWKAGDTAQRIKQVGLIVGGVMVAAMVKQYGLFLGILKSAQASMLGIWKVSKWLVTNVIVRIGLKVKELLLEKGITVLSWARLKATALLAVKIGIIVAGLTAIVAIIRDAIKYSDYFAAIFEDIGVTIKHIWQDFVAGIKYAMQKLLLFKDWVITLFKAKIVAPILQLLVERFAAFLSKIGAGGLARKLIDWSKEWSKEQAKAAEDLARKTRKLEEAYDRERREREKRQFKEKLASQEKVLAAGKEYWKGGWTALIGKKISGLIWGGGGGAPAALPKGVPTGKQLQAAAAVAPTPAPVSPAVVTETNQNMKMLTEALKFNVEAIIQLAKAMKQLQQQIKQMGRPAPATKVELKGDAKQMFKAVEKEGQRRLATAGVTM